LIDFGIKWIKSGGANFSGVGFPALPSLLERLMGTEGDLDERLEQLWQVLVHWGLVGKKLAVFPEEDASDIASQICAELGVICEAIYVQQVEVWIRDARRGEPLSKRLRGEHISDPLHAQVLQDKKRLSSTALASSSKPSTVSFQHGLVQRPEKQRVLDPEEAQARSRRESEAKDRWAKELYLELKKMEAPALIELEHCVSDKHLHLALAGRTRASTLKRYVKTWKHWLHWMEAVKGQYSAGTAGDLVEYLFCRYDEPCGPTVPVLIVKAVTWMERIACVPNAMRVGESQTVASVRDYIVEMLSKDAPPMKRAPRYPAAIMESLEEAVEDTFLPVGLRVIAWIKLVKIWGTLRWDDVQKIAPSELRFFGNRLTSILRVTKTTGPTKRAQELPLCVSEHAFISCPFWLKTGFDLLREHADFQRDYLLPKLTAELGGFRKAMASYNDVVSYSARLRKGLKRPGTMQPQMDPILSTFWTEHSERATLPTGLALLRCPREERDLLGRWKPDGSDTYVRMYSGVVTRLQQQFAKAARGKDRFKVLDEQEVIESAISWMTDRVEVWDDADIQHAIRWLEASMRWEPQLTWERVGEEDPVTAGDVEVPNLERAEVPPERDVREERNAAYIVVHTSKKCKRLHKVRDGCWMGREMVFKSSEEFVEMPDKSLYTHVCKVCWPKSSTVMEESSSSSSSTSSSNSQSSTSEESE